MSDRPEPAVRRPSRDVSADVVRALKTDDIITTNNREKLCQHCWNRTVHLRQHVVVRRCRLPRWIVALAVLSLAASCYAAWRSHEAQASSDALRVELSVERTK